MSTKNKQAKQGLKMSTENQHLRTKRGAATFYVVMTTMILVTVIITSFIRVMLSESTRTINTALSTSAYDSALAGVEDAKIALTRYHQCLGKTDQACVEYVSTFEEGVRTDSCDTIARALGRIGSDESQEVLIQEQYDASLSEDDPYAYAQAYTCVKIKETIEDYRATLDTANTTKLIPLWAANNANVASISIEWHTDATVDGTYDSIMMGDADSSKIPALLVDVYQTDQSFTLGQLSTNSRNGTNHAEVLLLPYSEAGQTDISAGTLLAASDKMSDTTHNPILTACGNDLSAAEFKCSSKIELPSTYNGGQRNTRTLALRITLPFGGTTDLAVKMYDNSGNQLAFSGIQAQIDSTGRANDLFRRVEARVDLIDSSFPYPEYTVEQTGSNYDLNRNLWVTNNCWSVDSGEGSGCNNSGQVTISN